MSPLIIAAGYVLLALIVAAYSTLVLAPMRLHRRVLVALLVGACWPPVLAIAAMAWLVELLGEATDAFERRR